MTGPVSGGDERGTGAPSRSTGMQGTLGAILIVLALGLALRLILAYLLPGSGFDADLSSFRFWADDLARNGLPRVLRAAVLPRLHAGLPVRPVAGRDRRQRPWRHRRSDQDPADPRRPRDRVPRVVDDPRARRSGAARPARRRGRGREPDLLVRQRRLGPGRLGRGRVRPPRPALAVARPARARRDLHGHRGAREATARDPRAARRGRDDPPGALAGQAGSGSRRGRSHPG